MDNLIVGLQGFHVGCWKIGLLVATYDNFEYNVTVTRLLNSNYFVMMFTTPYHLVFEAYEC